MVSLYGRVFPPKKNKHLLLAHEIKTYQTIVLIKHHSAIPRLPQCRKIELADIFLRTSVVGLSQKEIEGWYSPLTARPGRTSLGLKSSWKGTRSPGILRGILEL